MTCTPSKPLVLVALLIASFVIRLDTITGVFTSRKEPALSIGLWGATAGIAIAPGPIAGGLLLERYSWGSVFSTLRLVPLAVIALLAGALLVGVFPPAQRPRLPEPEHQPA